MRILLAEDETELGTWLVKALAQNDFQVDWVNDGRLVRRCLKATKYDALILDLGLPGLGGHDVLADLREADQRLPVLILTARDSLMERVSCLHGGADDFLAKPFDMAELEARLVALIRREPDASITRMCQFGQRKICIEALDVNVRHISTLLPVSAIGAIKQAN